jgi:prepilin-type N-terminal cleavage/methylation domain-containing protein
MKQKWNNAGFSLVELIIVVAIMAVLIGVLFPTYLRYVDRTKHTTDCASIGTVLDACEVLAADPDASWMNGDSITIELDTNKGTDRTAYSGSGPVTELKTLAPETSASIVAPWGPFTIVATKEESGHITFEMNDDDIAKLAVYSTALSERLE